MRALRGQAGVTYLLLMFTIVLIGLSITAAAKQWKTLVQRELEADLIAKGIEIQNAIALYSATQKAGRVVPGERYPPTLEELVKPSRPFLRKLYFDPITKGKWQIIPGPTGGIMGVRSPSLATPIKQSNFPPEVRHFEGLTRYHDWIFQFPNPSTPQQPAGTPTQPGGGTPPGGQPGAPPSPPDSGGVGQTQGAPGTE